MLSELESGAGWKWFGYAGHFIDGRRCAFHLSTLLPNGWLVSTVGHYLPAGEPEIPAEIGFARTFETMVFACGDTNPGDDPTVSSWSEVSATAYNDSREAERGHYAVCWEWANKEASRVA